MCACMFICLFWVYNVKKTQKKKRKKEEEEGLVQLTNNIDQAKAYDKYINCEPNSKESVIICLKVWFC